MAIIDPDGMFSGDRMAKLSDPARLYWPWFYVASNGFGRIEINYRKLIARVFSCFSAPPTEAEVMSFIREYFESYLLFLYKSNGQLWGQWETSEKYLPRHKTAADLKSPEPPGEALIKWREAYSVNKNAEVVELSTFSEIVREDSEKVRTDSEKVRENLRGVGVGVGVGGGKNICTSGDVPLADSQEKPTPKEIGRREREKWFDDLFWPLIWAKIGYGAARRIWVSKILTPELRDVVIAAAKKQRNLILERAAKADGRVLHPATWLSQERWKDEEPELPLLKPGGSKPSQALPEYKPDWLKVAENA